MEIRGIEIPPELVRKILDPLQNVDLKQISLVNKSWSMRTRCQIFSTIVLFPRKSSFEKLYNLAESRQLQMLPLSLEVECRSRSQTLIEEMGDGVEGLSEQEVSNREQKLLQEMSDDEKEILDDELAWCSYRNTSNWKNILQKFSHLRSVSLTHEGIPPMSFSDGDLIHPVARLESFLDMFRSIMPESSLTLQFSRTRNNELCILDNWTRAQGGGFLSNLRVLRFTCDNPISDFDYMLGMLQGCPHLQSFSLSVETHGHLGPWVSWLSNINWANLMYFELSGLRLECEDLALFLRHHESTLRELKFGPIVLQGEMEPSNPRWLISQLSRMTKVEQVVLRGLLDDSSESLLFEDRASTMRVLEVHCLAMLLDGGDYDALKQRGCEVFNHRDESCKCKRCTWKRSRFQQ